EEEGEDESPSRWRLPHGSEWIPVVLLIAVIALAFRPAKRQVVKALTGRHQVPQQAMPYPYSPQYPPGSQYPPGPLPGQYSPPQQPYANPYPQAPYQQTPYQQPQQNPYGTPAPVIPMPQPSKPVLRGVSGQYAGTALLIESTPGVMGRDPSLANLVFAADAGS